MMKGDNAAAQCEMIILTANVISIRVFGTKSYVLTHMLTGCNLTKHKQR